MQRCPRAALAAALLMVAACPAPAPAPVQPAAGGSAGGSAASTPPADASPVSDEEKLAAIQKAMNELDEAAQQCWAAAAVERFDIEGDIVAQIEIEAAGAKATLVSDTTRNAMLAACLTQLLGAYAWAPPLHGQTIRLPFRFRAPAGQNVIDRRLVPWKQQGKVAVAVLLDDANTGNDAFSLFDVKIDAGGSTGMRIAERGELWYLRTPGRVKFGKNQSEPSNGLEMVYVPAGAARAIEPAPELPFEGTVLVIPGGREGAARAGALPTREGAWSAKQPVPKVLRQLDAKTHTPGNGAKVKLFAEPATTGQQAVSASLFELPAGVTIPEHVHANETEVLYVTSGAGTLTIDGVPLEVTEHSVIQIPPNTKHAFTAKSMVLAVQFYTPAGPEQRFKAKP